MPPKNNNHNYRNKRQEEDIRETKKHVGVLNEEMGVVKIDVALIKNDTGWLKRFFWIVMTSSIGGLIAALINLLKG